jgi:hypothetical protein
MGMRLAILATLFLLNGAAHAATEPVAPPDPDKVLLKKVLTADADGHPMQLSAEQNTPIYEKMIAAVADLTPLSLKELGDKADELAKKIEKDGATDDNSFDAAVIAKTLAANEEAFQTHFPPEEVDVKARAKIGALQQLLNQKLRVSAD